MEITELLSLINEKHGTNFVLLKKYAKGEQGAFAVADGQGNGRVLKWQAGADSSRRLEQARLFIHRLQSLDYPAPAFLYIGTLAEGTYSIQEKLVGEVGETLPPGCLDDILRLNSIQKGQATADLMITPYNWPGRVIQPVLVGGEGFCILETMRNYSTSTVRLLDLLQTLVLKGGDRGYATQDIVHSDFSPLNLLTQAGRVTAVIDWQDPCAGDCTFDLVTMLFYCWQDQHIGPVLWETVLNRVGPEVAGVYLAHMILRQVEWSIRFHHQATINHWLNLTGSILKALQQHLSWLKIPNL